MQDKLINKEGFDPKSNVIHVIVCCNQSSSSEKASNCSNSCNKALSSLLSFDSSGCVDALFVLILSLLPQYPMNCNTFTTSSMPDSSTQSFFLYCLPFLFFFCCLCSFSVSFSFSLLHFSCCSYLFPFVFSFYSLPHGYDALIWFVSCV
eukprot:1078147_1